MDIIFHEQSRVFHLYNDTISYVMMILKNGQPGQLYFGRRIRDREDFSHLFELSERPMSCCLYETDKLFSMASIKQEYPVYGNGDYRRPAVEVLQNSGSRIVEFSYVSHRIFSGKECLAGLPALYVEEESEAMSLVLTLKDALSGLRLELLYTIYRSGGILARSARFVNEGSASLHLTRAMSLCLDLPDCRYEWLQLSGDWSRERHPQVRRLAYGIQAVDSMHGNSSNQHNPFVVLKRPTADEFQGEVLGFSLIYSGNFQIQAEVDSFGVTRMLLGIHPDGFDWKLEAGESFQTPEAVVVYSDGGLNRMSQTFHGLYRKRLARGYWRDRVRPILINNWEATYFDFNEDTLVSIAQKASECGIELFVMDDGWYGDRRHDRAGLGDWWPSEEIFPQGLSGLSSRIANLGMRFGLWIEPEMVNPDSALYRQHPDWVIHVPGRRKTHGRFQYVLDFSRKEVVDYLYGMISRVLREANASYVKWDMNRCITECYSVAYPADRQGEIFHRYILGVYDLYERLTGAFPQILFESCASGGARFDPGMLYYAPQCWTSDDTDAIERLKIQYGTSLCYPLSSMGAHVSMVPNHQVNRMTPLHTRANVAYFGTFGYELDLSTLSDEELAQVREQVALMKQYRHLFQFGTFYRLQSPFTENEAAWMVVSEDKREAIVGWYRILSKVNDKYLRLYLQGLDPDLCYVNSQSTVEAYGDELMRVGMSVSDISSGVPGEGTVLPGTCDFDSRLYILRAR